MEVEKSLNACTAACQIGLDKYLMNFHIFTDLNRRWTHPFINLPVLQLNKSGTNGCNVALLIGEGYSARPFWILKFRVCVYPSVTHSPIQTVHDHGELHWKSNTKRVLLGSEQLRNCTTFRGHSTPVPARRGRGTPPTKIVFLGSNG